MTTYAANDRFDLQTGMTVFDADGQDIGIVTDITGFGSTCVPPVGSSTESEPVIQARTGTGHFGVVRRLASVPDHLTVRFADIDRVTPGHGVTITRSGLEFAVRRQTADSPSILDTRTRRVRGSRLWPHRGPAAQSPAA